MEKKILFIDTDLGGDCDDVGALALANILKNNNLIEIAGMTHTTSLEWGPACIDIVNRYYGNGDIQIGATKRIDYCVEGTNKYASQMADAFEHSYHNRQNVINSVELMRKVLSESEDNSITFVCIGQLGDASDLLDSEADCYSPLNGVELVRQKVKEFVIMGGLFKEDKNEKVMFCGYEYSTEYNIVCDVKSARNFIEKVPVKVVFNDFKVGYQIHTAGPLLDQKDMTHPVTFSYTIFQNHPRESWDLLTVWYAAMELDDIFSISSNGHIDILEDGTTLFNPNIQSNHYYIRLNATDTYVVDKINNVLGGK